MSKLFRFCPVVLFVVSGLFGQLSGRRPKEQGTPKAVSPQNLLRPLDTKPKVTETKCGEYFISTVYMGERAFEYALKSGPLRDIRVFAPFKNTAVYVDAAKKTPAISYPSLQGRGVIRYFVYLNPQDYERSVGCIPKAVNDPFRVPK